MDTLILQLIDQIILNYCDKISNLSNRIRKLKTCINTRKLVTKALNLWSILLTKVRMSNFKSLYVHTYLHTNAYTYIHTYTHTPSEAHLLNGLSQWSTVANTSHTTITDQTEPKAQVEIRNDTSLKLIQHPPFKWTVHQYQSHAITHYFTASEIINKINVEFTRFIINNGGKIARNKA